MIGLGFPTILLFYFFTGRLFYLKPPPKLSKYAIPLISSLLTNVSQSEINTKSTPHHSLFSPWLNVSNFRMKYFSRSMRYSGSLDLVCSSIVTDKSARLWPGKLKWAPVVRLSTWFKMYPLWSASLYFNWRPLVPTYFSLHFWHVKR